MKLLTQWAVTSGVLILIVLAARYLLRDKLSARWRYALWAVVLVRLLVPLQVTIPARTSQAIPLLASNLAPTVDRWEERSVPVFPQGSRPVNEYNGITFDLMEPGEIMPTETSMGYYQRSADGETIIRYLDLWSPEQIVLLIWRSGAAVMALALLISNLRFARGLKKRGKRLEDMESPIPVYGLEGLPSPCLFGVFRPAVYVTPEAAENPNTLRHVLAHELTHYQHKDHIWSLLRCLTLALHWYNPLVWLAVILSKGDGELACDEGAVARLGEAERIPYGRTLVDMVAARSARPADLLSCSTAMTGGQKSIRQRVARLVKHPKTAKTALLAAAAVVALSVVFVFAQRGDSSANSLGDFPAQLEEAQCILVGQPLYYSSILPGTISDPVLLEQAKKLLTNPQPVYWLEPDGDWSGGWGPVSLDSNHPPKLITFEDLNDQFFHTGHPLSLYPDAGASQPENANRYWLVEWESLWLLAQWDAQNDARPFTLLGYYSGNVVSQLRELARQQGKLDRAALFGLDRFRSELEAANSIRLILPAYSSQMPPVPITDEELLVLAKGRLDNFVALDPDNVLTSWRDKLPFATQIVLSDGEMEAAYAILVGADNRTYLFTEDDYNACLTSGEGETVKIKPFARTKTETILDGSLFGYVKMQEERSRDPNFFVPMPYAEYQTYTPEFLREKGITRLQGWGGRIEDVKLFSVVYKARDYIQLRYYGDETHSGLWALVMDRETWAVVSDQPVLTGEAARQNSGRYSVNIDENPEALEALIQLFINDEDFLSQNAQVKNTTPEDIAAWLKGEGGEPIPPEVLIVSRDPWALSAFGGGSLVFYNLTIPDHLTAQIQDICQSFGIEISW